MFTVPADLGRFHPWKSLAIAFDRSLCLREIEGVKGSGESWAWR